MKKLLFISCLIVFFNCQKDEVLIGDRYAEISKKGSNTERLLDSLYMYCNEVWLWQKKLPNYNESNIRRYNNISVALYNLLGNVTNPKNGLAFEKKISPTHLKYSYIIVPKAKSSFGKSAGSFFQEYQQGFGFAVGEVNNEVRVVAVIRNSPAYKAGIKRGDKIIRVDNFKIKNSTDITNRLKNSTIKLTVKSLNTATVLTKKLTKTSFFNNPIYTHKIINQPNAKIGYLAYGSFTNNTTTKLELETIFSNFSKKGVSKLIIDLRYNQGGYVSSARYLANLIAPASLNGKKMYSEHYNQLMQQKEATILKNQPYFDANGNPVYRNNKRATYFDVNYSVASNTYWFKKKGNLEVKHIYIITSNKTASASEMLINVLKPYIKVTLVGTKTYGKPVGFMGINLNDYKVYLSSFLIKNAKGNSDYFEGFKPDIYAEDDITKNFGSINENCIKKIINKPEEHSTNAQRKIINKPKIIMNDNKLLIKQNVNF